MAMRLGSLTIDTYTPDQVGIPMAQKHVSVQPTYGGAKFFSWGMFLAGQTIKVQWDWMDQELWDQINNIYAADGTVNWQPDDAPGGKTYETVIAKFDGAYMAGVTFPYRENVVMELAIIKEVP